MKLNTSNIIHNINSKLIKDLGRRPETMKFIEDYIREKLHNIGVCNDFMAMTPKPEAKNQK